MRLARNFEGFFCVSVLVACIGVPLLPSGVPEIEPQAATIPAHTVTVVGNRDDAVVVAIKR